MTSFISALFKHQRFRVPEARKANRKVWGEKQLKVYLSKGDTIGYHLPKHSVFEIKRVPKPNALWVLIDFQGTDYWIETKNLATCIALDDMPPLTHETNKTNSYDAQAFSVPMRTLDVQRQNFVYHPVFGICIVQDYAKDYLPAPEYISSLVLKSVQNNTEHRVWANTCYVTP